MYNLPLACMSKETRKKIGSSVGVVEEVDVHDDEPGWGEYLKVKIRVDLKKPLARGRILHVPGRSLWIAFKYEKNYLIYVTDAVLFCMAKKDVVKKVAIEARYRRLNLMVLGYVSCFQSIEGHEGRLGPDGIVEVVMLATTSRRGLIRPPGA